MCIRLEWHEDVPSIARGSVQRDTNDTCEEVRLEGGNEGRVMHHIRRRYSVWYGSSRYERTSMIKTMLDR